MTAKEANEKLNDLLRRRTQAHAALVVPARAAVNVLKDLNQHSTARDLEAALFTLDAIDAEFTEAIKENPKAFLEAALEGMRG